MKIRLELNGPLKLPRGEKSVEVKVCPGIRVSEVLARVLECSPEQAAFLQVTRDGKNLEQDRPIEKDCTLRVFLRLGGG